MQNTAYDMRISDWSSDVCSSDLRARAAAGSQAPHRLRAGKRAALRRALRARVLRTGRPPARSARRADAAPRARIPDRKRVVKGKSVSVRVDLGGRRIIKKKQKLETDNSHDIRVQKTCIP